MPLNGSGTYAAPASTWNPAVSNTTINSTDWTALLADLTTALSTAMFKDGQATPTANIGMGGFKITNLAAGTLVSDAARVSQVQNSSFTSLTSVAGTNTVTATATPTPAAYVVGQVFEGIAAATNTGAVTLNISSLGAGAVQVGGAALTGNELIINSPFRVIVSAVTPVFQLVANGRAAVSVKTVTFTRDTSVASGTQAVTGVGFMPRAVIFIAGLTTGTAQVSVGMDEGTTPACMFNNSNSSVDTWGISLSNSITFIQSGAAVYEGKISAFGSDGFTVTWTKTGLPSGTNTIAALCFR